MASSHPHLILWKCRAPGISLTIPYSLSSSFPFISLMAGSSLVLPACGLLLKGLSFRGWVWPGHLPIHGPLSHLQAFTASPLLFATKPGVPHHPAVPLGLQAPTKTLGSRSTSTLRVLQIQPVDLEPWNRPRAQQRSMLLSDSVSSPVLKAASCLMSLWTPGLSGPGMALVPPVLHFASRSSTSFPERSPRVTQGWEKPFSASAHMGAPEPLCH